MMQAGRLGLCCSVVIMLSSVVLARPQSSANLQMAATLVLRSADAVDEVQTSLLQLYELTEQSAFGAYSSAQRIELDGEFQEALATIDCAVEKAAYRRYNMLNAEGQTVTVLTGDGVVSFDSVDITLAGLQLDSGLSIAEIGDAWAAYDGVTQAVCTIKQVDLQFTDYRNALSVYLSYITPVWDKEVRQALDNVAASKEAARTIAENLSRAIDLARQADSGEFSAVQLMILNAEFQELLASCDGPAERAYYGMGLVDSNDILWVNSEDEVLQLDCFDLTVAGLGLEGDFSLEDSELLQVAYDAVVEALQEVIAAIFELDDYTADLSAYSQDDNDDEAADIRDIKDDVILFQPVKTSIKTLSGSRLR